MSKNRTVVEIHGCVVCAKLFNILVVYTPEGKLLDSTVTTPGGHIVSNEQRPLVICDAHAKDQIKSVHEHAQSIAVKETVNEQEEK